MQRCTAVKRCLRFNVNVEKMLARRKSKSLRDDEHDFFFLFLLRYLDNEPASINVPSPSSAGEEEAMEWDRHHHALTSV